MKKFITLTLSGLIISAASFAQLVPLTASTTTICTGGMAYISEMDSTSGGTWSSSNTAVATVTPWSGWTGTEIVTGISAGTSTITYTATPGGSYVTTVFTISGTAPAAITGTTSLCIGTPSTLSDATVGGSWSSSSPGVATIGSATGVVTAVAGGSSTISYSIGGCGVSTTITVGPTVVDSVTGPSSVCAGSAITLSDLTPGGTWSSSSTGVATVSATGIVTGEAAGSSNIIYTVTGCGGSSSSSMHVTVLSITTAGTISGSSSILAGTYTALSETVAGGAWSSSNTSVATVSGSGNVAGVSAGGATISYTVSGCGSAYTATAPMTVTALNGISGYVNVDPTGVESFRVWLITYNPATLDLEASDSTDISGTGSVYYQFTGVPTDSFRIKAAVTSSSPYDSVYAPTYHTSSFYWHDAAVLYHTSGTGDINQNINMAYGTTTSGPGFIGGSVTSGANKGTSGGAAAAGILIYALNASGVLVAQTYTDASGNYGFSALPLGAYTIYPELINYSTIAYTSINLTGSAHSMTAASFIQHTVSKTITPIVEGVNNVKATVSSVTTFPNPTGGNLNVQWNETATEKATVTIADITGRELYKTTINMTEGMGATQLDLSGFANGVYVVSVKSGTIDYNGKVEKQ